MIGIDTNILVRYYAQDDPVQSRVATEFLEEGLRVEPGYDRSFLSALRRFENTAAEFTDLMIASTARHAGCSETYTFDEGAAKKAGMTLLR